MTATAHLPRSRPKTTLQSSGMNQNNFLKLFLATEVFSCDRNTPADKTKSPVTYDDMVELYNQTSIYIGKADFKLMFWDTKRFLKSLQPNWKKWQKVWKNHIKYYTPRTKPQQPDVDVAGIIEKWNTKRKANESQIATISVSPMFGLDIVDLYTQCNESYNPTAPIKTADAATSLRKLVALEIKFMVGCDCEWN